MTEASAYDVYLSYNRSDVEVVRELEKHLVGAGLSVWRDEAALEPGVDWQSALASALSQAGFVAVCVGPTGLASGQLREIEVADARAASEPDFRFAAVLLPGVPEGFSSAALPAQLASRQWIDLRSGLDQASVLVNAISGFQAPAPAEAEAQPPVTPSVERAASLLGDDAFTAAALVAAVLQIHPEYGERKGGSVKLDVQTGEEMPASAWIDRVRELLDPAVAQELHGRLLIVGLARIDSGLRMQLEAGGFLAALEREIREPLATLFVDEPAPPEETVPTHTDNPATVDALNRQGVALILARRIRAMRAHEDGSFLVHVHGPWGSGKTSILNFLRDELHKPDRQAVEDGDPGAGRPWVVVTFNAWQHQRLAPPWWWLMMALYRQGFSELWRLDRRRALAFRGREWLWRLKGGWQGILLVLIGVGLLVALWQTGAFDALGEEDVSYEALKALIVGVAAILAPLLTIWGVVRGLSRWLLTASARGARFYMDHARDPMETTKEHFKQLVDWLGHPLLVVVDDLDRCRPGFVVELLEGIQTLFREVPVAYVVAADREWLANSYAAEYTSFEGAFDRPGRPLGYLFLEKTFQMTIPVPALSPDTRDGYWRRLIRPEDLDDGGQLDGARAEAAEIFGQLETEEEVREELARNPGTTPAEQRARVEAAAVQLATPKLERAAEHVLQPFRPLLDANPRAMKRLVNAYGVARGIELLSHHSLRWDKQAQHQTALWTILSLRWPRLAEYLAGNPDAAERIGADGAVPGDLPTDLAPLLTDAEVEQVVLGQAEGVQARLDPSSIRASVSA
jgi:hypothetical protein